MIEFGQVLDEIGDFGRFQIQLLVLLSIPNFLSAFYFFAQIFMVLDETHYCLVAWVKNETLNLSISEQLSLAIPLDAAGNPESCLMFRPPPDNASLEDILGHRFNETQPCDSGWEYPENKALSLQREMKKQNNAQDNHRFSLCSMNSNQHHDVPSNSWSLDLVLHRLRTTETKKEDVFSSILNVIGHFGTFQRRLVALILVPNILSSFFLFADTFMFTEQKHYCNTSWILEVGPNLSEAEQMHLTLPREANGTFHSCLMYLPVAWTLDSIMQFGLNQTQRCLHGWVYPEATKRSLINEFDLVCDKEPKLDIEAVAHLVGALIGSVVFGFMSDRLGRHPTILLSLLGMTVFGFGAAFVRTFYQYLFCRFGMFQASICYSISSTSLVSEWLVGEHRSQAIILEHCFFSMGIMLLSGLAYSLPHWRLLLLLGGVPSFPLISYIWILPESPRWLMVKGKVGEAKKLLCSAADKNQKTIPSYLLDKISEKNMVKASVLDFYNNDHLRKVTLVILCVWFAIGYSYFTLALQLQVLELDTYLIHMLSSLLEVPARLCCIFLLEHIGRKWSVVLTLVQGCLMCSLILLLPPELKSTRILMVLFGKFIMSSSATVFFLYSAELLPTIFRATGLGLVTLAVSAGAILSLTLIKENYIFLAVFFCCISAILAVTLSTVLPETKSQPLSDNLELFSPSTESSMDSVMSDVSEEVAKNTLLNATMLSLDKFTSQASSEVKIEEANSMREGRPRRMVSVQS
ncbi:solute carrier family 22 member 13 isoform X1 [Erinaceus europaeus]|uniref:Solute carrier family 22 member 13 isoform X1 n=2 Tax=Erinaceus europaeus TaxID=9365 RepID=A0ABM3WJ54_ERIEU|nr:solute carrier family 22 member 13 isoform X1 [Erinaceus europaeus]